MEKINYYILIGYIVLSALFLGISILNLIRLDDENTLLKEKIIQVKMDANFEDRFINTKGITGLNYGDYFCVWAKDRTYSQVIETCNHEWLHHRWGEEHFTG